MTRSVVEEETTAISSEPFAVTTAIGNDGLQYLMEEAQKYAQKKQACQDEISGCVYQLVLSSGKPFMEAGAVDACLDGYPDCKGVHACDQNGEVIPITPDPPKTFNNQKPAPYIYGKMACEKQLIINSEGQQWYEYTIEAPTLCNPASNPANGPVTFSFQFNDKYKANAALCEPTDPAQTGVTFYEMMPKMSDYFKITTVGDLLDKSIAYATSIKQLELVSEYTKTKESLVKIGQYNNKDNLAAKTCMLTLPQSGGVPFVAGALPGVPTNFPAEYYIFSLQYGYKVAIKQVAVQNVDGYCSYNGCTSYQGSSPNLCSVTLSVE
jgi:hypothetical protein